MKRIEVDEHTAETIMNLAAAKKMSVNDFLRALTETNGTTPGSINAMTGVDQIPQGESLRDALARRGLLGCLTGGPADLSTNAQHMEGFGDSRTD